MSERDQPSADKLDAPTPRTDDLLRRCASDASSFTCVTVLTALARQLERELAAMTADRDMWLADDVKQNNALGRVLATRSAGVSINLPPNLRSTLLAARNLAVAGSDQEQMLQWCIDRLASFEERLPLYAQSATGALSDAMGLNDNALNEAGWELLRVAGPAIPTQECKRVARAVLVAYINSVQRQKADK